MSAGNNGGLTGVARLSDPSLELQVKLDKEMTNTRTIAGQFDIFRWVQANNRLRLLDLDLELVRDTYWSHTGLSEPLDRHCIMRQMPGLGNSHTISVPWPHHVATPLSSHTATMRLASPSLQEMSRQIGAMRNTLSVDMEQNFYRPVARFLFAEKIVDWLSNITTPDIDRLVVVSASKFKNALSLDQRPSTASWQRCGSRVVEQFLDAKAMLNRELDKHVTNMRALADVGITGTYAMWDAQGTPTKWRGGATAQWFTPPPTLPGTEAVAALMTVMGRCVKAKDD